MAIFTFCKTFYHIPTNKTDMTRETKQEKENGRKETITRNYDEMIQIELQNEQNADKTIEH